MSSNAIGIYFHWPFCLAKCPYCDFNVHIHEHIDHAAWERSYIRALEYYAGIIKDRQVVSVFFGGGTPSLMEPQTIRSVLSAIKDHWDVAPNVEVTLEANPTSIEAGKFEKFKNAGVNRVSIGVQSFNDKDLKFLGRKHDRAQALKAIATARSIFDRFSFDLIYARPDQSLSDWESELNFALEQGSDHLSLYQLTIERSTPFFFDHAQGKFSMPDDGKAADFYLRTQEIMDAAGLPAYEVSNHAKRGAQSLHNMIYWNYGDYIGIGPGAHGRLLIDGKKIAVRDHSAPDIWRQKVDQDGFGHHPFEALNNRERFVEALMMGLRLMVGVPMERLETEGQCNLDHIIDMPRLEKMITEQWLVYDGKTLVATRAGMLRLNSIVPYILK